MFKPDIALVIVLRLIGISALFAIPVVFFPTAWLERIHHYIGLGEMPRAPVVDYLARSMSAMYAMCGILMLFISFDIHRYGPLIKLWGILAILMGIILLGIDLAIGMPIAWTIGEGPFTIAAGIAIVWLQSVTKAVTNGFGQRE